MKDTRNEINSVLVYAATNKNYSFEIYKGAQLFHVRCMSYVLEHLTLFHASEVIHLINKDVTLFKSQV
jgi:hypothetical protein